MFYIKNIHTITNMKGRKLPRTTTIIHHENNALKNKVKCLEESLKSAYDDIQKFMNIINENAEIEAKLIEENEKLKADNKQLKQKIIRMSGNSY